MTPESLALCRTLAANQRLPIEERAAIAELVATVERLGKLPSLWGGIWHFNSHAFDDESVSDGRLVCDRRMRNHIKLCGWPEDFPFEVVPLTLAAMIEDERGGA